MTTITTDHPVIQAATALTAILAEENAALAALDIPLASLLVERKRAATDALLAAHRRGAAPATPDAIAIAGRLKQLADENKTLLERAMVAQNRVMACIAAAIPKTIGQDGRYGAGGTVAITRSMPAVALSARA